MGKKFGQRGHCLLVTPIDKKTLGGQTPEHVVMAEGFDQPGPGGIEEAEGRGIVIFVNKTVDAPMLTIAVRVEVGVTPTGLGSIATSVRVRRGVVLDDEVIPVRDPEVSIRANLGYDGGKPFVGARYQTKGVDGFETRPFGPNLVHAKEVTGRSANEGPAITPGFGKSG